MFKYIIKRILSSILVLLGVITITFFIARVIPSNPEVKWAGQRATPEQLEAAGIYQNTIRLSIGTEHIDDIIWDLEQGFEAAAKVNQ